MEDIIIIMDESTHQFPQQNYQKEEDEQNKVNRTGIIQDEGDSIQQQKHNVEVLELNSISQYMKQDMIGNNNNDNKLDYPQEDIIQSISISPSRHNLESNKNNNSINLKSIQMDLPKINILKSISMQSQISQNDVNINQSSHIVSSIQQEDNKIQSNSNKLLDFENIEEMKIIAQAVQNPINNIKIEEQQEIKNDVSNNEQINEEDIRLNNDYRKVNNFQINKEIDRSYLSMQEQSKLNSANHSIILGFDSNTSRFIQPDTTAISRREMMLMMEEQEKDISAIQRMHDNTNIPLNNEFDNHLQTFTNQLDHSHINKHGNYNNSKNINLASSQDSNKKSTDLPSQDNTSNAIASSHLGLLSTSARQSTSKYKMRQKRLNLEINIDEIERSEKKRQAQREARLEQQKRQQQEQNQGSNNQNNINDNNENNDNNVVNEQNIQLNRNQQNIQNQNADLQNRNNNNNISDNIDILIPSQFENNLSNQIFQKTMLLQIKLLILFILGFAIFFDESIRNHLLVFITIILFLIFFYQLIVTVRTYKREMKVSYQEKYRLAELLSFMFYFITDHIMVKYLRQPVTLVILYTPILHIVWWRSVMRQTNSNSFLINVQLFFRIFIFIQVFFISLKYDSFVSWQWMVVFIPSWLLLIGLIFYFIQILVLTLWYFINLLRSKATSSETFGFFWGMISFTCYSICFYFCMDGLISYFDQSEYKSNREKLREQEIYQNMQQARRRNNEINNFVIEQSRSQSSQFNVDEQPPIDRFEQKNQKFKSNNFNFPLFMIQNSSTYFQQVEQRKKDIESQQKEILDSQRVGNTFRHLNYNKEKESITDRQRDNNHSIASRNMLINQLSNINESNMPGLPIERLENLINSPKRDMIYQQKTFNQTRAAQLPSNRNSQKKGSIKAEINQMFSPSAKSSQSDKEQQTCLVCFVNQPDSVLMPCGHGGICSKCARDVCKKNGCCYLCRQDVQNIYKIENAMNSKLRKVIGITEIKRKPVPQKHISSSNNQIA